jgi:putative chitinase
VAAFLAQCSHESAQFTRLEENLYYSTPARISTVWPRLASRARSLAGNPRALANAAYANRNGNGDEGSDDGWLYRGGGLIQLTGRANYRQRGFEDHPETVRRAPGACVTAVGYWTENKLNALADNGDFDGITRRVNGKAMAGAADRRKLHAKFLRALKGQP